MFAAGILLTPVIVTFLYKRLPQQAGFFACLCKADSPGTLSLILRFCSYDSLKTEKEHIDSFNYDVCYHGEVMLVCYHGDVIFFSLVSLTVDGELPEEEMYIYIR